MKPSIHLITALLACASVRPLFGDNTTAVLSIDAAADRQAIHPGIYGVAFATADELRALNAPLNRHGGNWTTRYNWKLNATNCYDADGYFESMAEFTSLIYRPAFSAAKRRVAPGGDKPGMLVDELIENSRAGGASAMVTIPINGWVAKLGPGGGPLWSYSIAKYGAQTKHDPAFPDAGNGIRASDGTRITDNDPNDANQMVTPEFQRGWLQHLVRCWKKAADGGVRYYLMDNEPSLWWVNHFDALKTGMPAAELRDAIADYATMIRQVDPGALIGGPEEWGWPALALSGLDQQWGEAQKKLTGSYPDRTAAFPDRAARGGMDYMPWLLKELQARERATGVRLLDVFTFHFYPQGGEFSDDVSPAMQLTRNRSTRSLWDQNYRDPSWINDFVQLIPRMHELVAAYYPGRAIGITEYSWGAENHVNGATAQADILGIFGREGLDVATHWVSPVPGSPVFKTFQMYRNYDGQRSTFGDTHVGLTNSANVDELAAFAAERSYDGALTVMIVAKNLSGARPVDLKLDHFAAGAKGQVWQLTAANTISRLGDLAVEGNRLGLIVPPQSITLLVLPKAAPSS